MTEEARDLLSETSVNLPTLVPAEFQRAPKSCPRLLEMELLPLISMYESHSNPKEGRDICAGCGAVLKPKKHRQEVRMPRGVDICRADDWTTQILASERFVKTVEELHLTGLAWELISN